MLICRDENMHRITTTEIVVDDVEFIFDILVGSRQQNKKVEIRVCTNRQKVYTVYYTVICTFYFGRCATLTSLSPSPRYLICSHHNSTELARLHDIKISRQSCTERKNQRLVKSASQGEWNCLSVQCTLLCLYCLFVQMGVV